MQTTLSRMQRLLKVFRSSNKTASKNISSSTTAAAARPIMSGKHQGAILPGPGQRIEIVERATPEPGPDEILVEAKAIGMNLLDWVQRDFGMMLDPAKDYPAIVGSDVAGIVTKIGSNVKDAPAVGSRVISFSSSFFNHSANHGAFQKYSLAGPEGVIALPDKYSFEEGAVFPLAVYTALSGWTSIGIPLNTKYSPADKEAVLVWGGSTSVGTIAIQSAKSMGFTVYTTAGAKNLDYVKSLGADAAFDHKAADVVQQIVNQAKADGVKLRTAQVDADGGLQPTLDVLKETKNGAAKVCHAPQLQPDHPTLEETQIAFTWPPNDPAELKKHLHYAYHDFLEAGLKNGTVVPSPRVQAVPGGLASINDALDTLKGGVSATKVVVTGV